MGNSVNATLVYIKTLMNASSERKGIWWIRQTADF